MALTAEDVEVIRALIAREVGPLARATALAVSRGVVRRVEDDAGTQTVQVSLLGDESGDEEVADDVEHFQPFGLSFTPPAGSEIVALSVAGQRDHVVGLGATSRAHRPRGAGEGEGGLYVLDGWRVYCDGSGHVYLGGDAASATHAVALAAKVEAQLEAIAAALDTATAPMGGGAVSYGTPYTGPGPDGVGSEKVSAVE